MSTEKQRWAIAYACGWRWSPTPDPRVTALLDPPGNSRCHILWETISTDERQAVIECNVPDYPNDLNAMHEAEKTLTNEQFERYWCDLWTTECDLRASAPTRHIRAFVSATAAQRAEAFLRTVGKWEDAA